MALDAAEAIPLLIAVLNDEQEKLYPRRMAATILGLLRDERAIAALAQTLSASDASLRASAAEALGRFEAPEDSLVQRLIQGLQDDDYFVRETCAKTLGRLKRPDALPALTRMSIADSVSTNREVAQQAIEAIRRAG